MKQKNIITFIKPLYFTLKYSISKGPFDNPTFYQSMNSKYKISKDILFPESIPHLTKKFIEFHKNLKAADYEGIKKICTPKFYNYLNENYLSECKENKNFSFDFTPNNDNEIIVRIDHLRKYYKIMGLDIDSQDNKNKNFTYLDFVPLGVIKNIFFYQKKQFLKSCFFCNSLTFIEVVFTSNLSIEFYENTNEGKKTVLTRKSKEGEKFIWQFVINRKNEKKPDLCFEGWRINNINNYVMGDNLQSYLI